MTKWKRSIKGMDFGTIDIRIRDHNGTVIWDFKRRGKNNIPDGIWGFSQFLKEKMGYELVSLLMEMARNDEKFAAALKERSEQADGPPK
jgi:hypothetical protein